MNLQYNPYSNQSKLGMSKKTNHEKKLQQMTQIELRLSEIKDVDILLENILTSACEIVNADAGSIYSYDENENFFYIKIIKKVIIKNLVIMIHTCLLCVSS